MDGYTVDEAASVLGVPQARVWELLARGVLAGAPEGESGMRVFLKGSAGEEVTNRPERAEPGRGSNGSGGHNGSESGEMSPFRELLSEFRNLTERYGQALLALGEARGEVASLRSRVELLEARIDLRLPSSRPASTVAWEMPDYAPPPPPSRTDGEAVPEPEAAADGGIAPDAERATEPAPAAEPAPATEPESIGPIEAFADAVSAEEVPAEDAVVEEAVVEELPAAEGPAIEAGRAVAAERATSRRKRLHPGREAISGLAEALARAQDPTLADLPGAREAAEAMAQLRREIDAGTVAEQVAEETLEEAGAVVEEPEAVGPMQPEPEAVEEPITAAAVSLGEIALDEEAVPEAPVTLEEEAPAFEEEIALFAEVAMPEEEAAVAEEPSDEAPAFEDEAAVVGEPAPTEDTAGIAELSETEQQLGATPEPAGQPSHYSTDVVEPDWFADGDFTWLEAAEAERAEAGVGAEAPTEVHDEAPADGATAEASAAEPPAPSEGTESPEDSMETITLEVETIEAALPEPELPAVELPSAELPTPANVEEVAADQGEPGVGLAEPVVEEAPEATPPSVHEVALAALMDEAWNEPTGEPAWDEPPEAPVSAPVPEFESELDTRFEDEEVATAVEAAATDLSEDWPAMDTEPSEPIAPASAPVERPAPESRPGPPAGDALGGFRAASDEELRQPLPGLARADEEELMWLGDEFEAAGLEIASQGWRGEGQPAENEATKPPVFELSDEELTRLARDEGWNLDEVNAIRTFLGRPGEEHQAAAEPPAEPPAEPLAEPPSTAEPAETTGGQPHEPGPGVTERVPAAEAAEATGAETHARDSEPAEAPPAAEAPPVEDAEPLPPFEAPAETMEAAELSRRLAAPSTSHPDTSYPGTPAEPRSLPGQPDPEWLRGRRGPAATAYRRLRRLFPG